MKKISVKYSYKRQLLWAIRNWFRFNPFYPDMLSQGFIPIQGWKHGRLNIIPVIKAFHSLASFTDLNADFMA